MTSQTLWVGSAPLERCDDADCRAWSRGYATGPDGSTYLGGEIAWHLARNRPRLAATAARLNGCFTAVLQDGSGTTQIVSDRIGAVPVYLGPRGAWRGRPAGMAVSDDPWAVVEGLPEAPRIAPGALVDMLHVGYVTGNGTLLAGLSSAAPAAITTIEAGKLRVERYWRYGYEPEPMEEAEAGEALAAILTDVTRRAVAVLDRMHGRAVLTLSGGLDSRLLAGLLAGAAPIQRPAALSYGVAADPEVQVAAEVARALGYGFGTVAVDQGWLNPGFLARSVREVGLTTRFTCGVGARHLECRPGDVLVPGHTGDFVSGGHLPPHAALVGNRAQLHRFLDLRHMRYPGSGTILRQVLQVDPESRFDGLARSTAEFDMNGDRFGLIDRWNVENRQRRLILMELRAYEQLAPWILPFYDHELLDFFARLPHRLRLGQRLYVETAVNRVFTGPLAALAAIRRVGKPLRVDARAEPRTAAFARIPAALRTPLLAAWPLAREMQARLRPAPVQTSGPDPLAHWFRTDAAARSFLTERLRAVAVPGLDTNRLLTLAAGDATPEAFFHRVVPAAITVQEALETARQRWQAARSAG